MQEKSHQSPGNTCRKLKPFATTLTVVHRRLTALRRCLSPSQVCRTAAAADDAGALARPVGLLARHLHLAPPSLAATTLARRPARRRRARAPARARRARRVHAGAARVVRAVRGGRRAVPRLRRAPSCLRKRAGAAV